MSGLFQALNIGTRSLQAQQAAITTTGHNISNANTEGYSRQRVDFITERPQWQPFGQLGTGVQVGAIQRIVDIGLQARQQLAISGLGRYQTIAQYLQRGEIIFNELSDTDISSAFEQYFNALNDLNFDVQSSTARQAVLQSGNSLAASFRQVGQELVNTRNELSDRIALQAGEINRLSSEIAQLNEEIQRVEVGGTKFGSANDLRDQRELALRQLSQIIDITTHETSTGVVNVLVGSDFLVQYDDSFEVGIRETAVDSVILKDLQFVHNGKMLEATGGIVAGLVQSRDTYYAALQSDLDMMANTFIFEFNKAQATGRGLAGLTSVTSGEKGMEVALTLDQLSLDFPIQDGSFKINLTNEATGQTMTYTIDVDLDGLNNDDTTLQSLVDQINTKIQGDFPSFSASVNSNGQLVMQSSDTNYTFYFTDDTSNLLAAVGINRFFAGSRALDITLAGELEGHPELLSAALSTDPGDNSNLLKMLGLRDQKLFNNQTATFEQFYQGIVGGLGVFTADFTARADNQTFLTEQLENERLSVSGVDINEEAANLIIYQRAFQASARLISAVDELLQTLLSI